MKKSEEAKRPNILWICSDQQRQDTLGCYGNDFVRTPCLDKLATEGAIFDNAFCNSPICTPSRGSFLTGRYPSTSRTRQSGADFPASEVLISKLLHDRGYFCGLAGKLHLSACHPASGCVECERRINDGYDEFHWSHDSGSLWGLNNEYYRWYHDMFGDLPKVSDRKDCKYVQTGVSEERSQTAWCANIAIDFIERQKDTDRPWLFSVNMYNPHHPFDPPQELLERYLDILDKIPLPSYTQGEEQTKTIWQQNDHKGAYGGIAGYPYDEMTPNDHRLVRAAYWALCDMIDNQVGRILEALEHSGQSENTIVIYMSDHGELLGDHGMYLKGPHFYDCSIKVPLIIRYPDHVPVRRYKTFVELMDLPETLLDLCGIPIYEGMQGNSFAHLFVEDASDLHRESVYSDYLNSTPWNTPKAFASMIRTASFKLVETHGQEQGELYDLQRDPGEHENLYKDSSVLPVKAMLLKQLVDRWACSCDPLPVRTSDF